MSLLAKDCMFDDLEAPCFFVDKNLQLGLVTFSFLRKVFEQQEAES